MQSRRLLGGRPARVCLALQMLARGGLDAVTAAYMWRIVCQAAGFLLLARALGARDFGAVAAASGLLAIAVPFAGFGYANVVVRTVSRDVNAAAWSWHRCQALLLATCVIGLVVFPLTAPLFLHTSYAIKLVGLLVLAELGMNSLTNSAGLLLLAANRRRTFAALLAISSSSRLIAVLVAGWIFPGFGVLHWAVIYVLTTTGAAAAALLVARKLIGSRARCRAPTRQSRPRMSDVMDGVPFAIGLASRGVYDDADKVMLASLASLQSAAIYAGAYRFVTAAAAPALAQEARAYPELFRAGGISRAKLRAVTMATLKRTSLLGVMGSAALLAASPLLGPLLGPGFGQSGAAMRWLCFLPALQGVHFVLGDAVTGGDRPGVRVIGQLVAAVFNVVINIWAITAWGWRGAALGTFCSEGALTLWLLWVFLRMTSSGSVSRTAAGFDLRQEKAGCSGAS